MKMFLSFIFYSLIVLFNNCCCASHLVPSAVKLPNVGQQMFTSATNGLSMYSIPYAENPNIHFQYLASYAHPTIDVPAQNSKIQMNLNSEQKPQTIKRIIRPPGGHGQIEFETSFTTPSFRQQSSQLLTRTTKPAMSSYNRQPIFARSHKPLETKTEEMANISTPLPPNNLKYKTEKIGIPSNKTVIHRTTRKPKAVTETQITNFSNFETIHFNHWPKVNAKDRQQTQQQSPPSVQQQIQPSVMNQIQHSVQHQNSQSVQRQTPQPVQNQNQQSVQHQTQEPVQLPIQHQTQQSIQHQPQQSAPQQTQQSAPHQTQYQTQYQAQHQTKQLVPQTLEQKMADFYEQIQSQYPDSHNYSTIREKLHIYSRPESTSITTITTVLPEEPTTPMKYFETTKESKDLDKKEKMASEDSEESYRLQEYNELTKDQGYISIPQSGHPIDYTISSIDEESANSGQNYPYLANPEPEADPESAEYSGESDEEVIKPAFEYKKDNELKSLLEKFLQQLDVLKLVATRELAKSDVEINIPELKQNSQLIGQTVIEPSVSKKGLTYDDYQNERSFEQNVANSETTVYKDTLDKSTGKQEKKPCKKPYHSTALPNLGMPFWK